MSNEKVRPAAMDRNEAATYLGVSPSTIGRLAKSGDLPHVVIGGSLRFRVLDLDRFLESKVTTVWNPESRDKRGHLAEQVRMYCKEHFVDPARERGATTVTIRCGSVHREMHFVNRLPLVCAALRAKAFSALCRVELVTERGVRIGANAYFTYELL